jgi:hypothetical protein
MRRNSNVWMVGSPLDNAIANSQPLYVKPTYQGDHPYAGMLCRAVGGTRGRPTVQMYGVGERVVSLDVDKIHLKRARLPAGVIDLEARGRPLAAAYLRSIEIIQQHT